MQWIDGNTHPIETMLDQCCLGLGKGVVDEEEREHIRKIILNQRKLKNIVNETLLFVETRALPRRPMTLTSDPIRWGVRERTGSASERVRYVPISTTAR